MTNEAPRPPLLPFARETAGPWYRAYGNEQGAFDGEGHMSERHASINDRPIAETERLFHWPAGHRPADHPGLSELGL